MNDELVIAEIKQKGMPDAALPPLLGRALLREALAVAHQPPALTAAIGELARLAARRRSPGRR